MITTTGSTTKGLVAERITVRYGSNTAVDAVSLDVARGEIVGLIGPNGAGKTTVFNVITGVYQPTEGAVTFQGRNLAGLRVNEIVELGIARTFQNIRLFGSMNVLDNVRTAMQVHRPHGIRDALLRMGGFRRGEADVERQVMELLEIFGLHTQRDEMAHAQRTNQIPYALLDADPQADRTAWLAAAEVCIDGLLAGPRRVAA